MIANSIDSFFCARLLALVILSVFSRFISLEVSCGAEAWQDDRELLSIQGEQLLAEVLKTRRAITEGEFVLSWDYVSKPGAETIPGSSRSFVKGELLRGERFVGGQFRSLNGFGCHEGRFVQLVPWIDGERVLIIKDTAKVSRHFEKELEPDPRLLGLIPQAWGFCAYYSPDVLFTPETAVVRTDDQIGDLACYRLEFNNKKGTKICFWIAPSQNNGVVKSSLTVARSDQSIWTGEMQSELKEVDNSGIFFPRKLEFRETHNGKPICSQKIVVQKVSFQEVPKKVFSIAGMDLVKEGTKVFWESSEPPPAEGELFWDGKVIRGEFADQEEAVNALLAKNADVLTTLVESENSNRILTPLELRQSWLKFNFGLVFLLVGAWLFWRLGCQLRKDEKASV